MFGNGGAQVEPGWRMAVPSRAGASQRFLLTGSTAGRQLLAGQLSFINHAHPRATEEARAFPSMDHLAEGGGRRAVARVPSGF